MDGVEAIAWPALKGVGGGRKDPKCEGRSPKVVGGDDVADCLRYLVATKERTIEQRKLRGL